MDKPVDVALSEDALGQDAGSAVDSSQECVGQIEAPPATSQGSDCVLALPPAVLSFRVSACVQPPRDPQKIGDPHKVGDLEAANWTQQESSAAEICQVCQRLCMTAEAGEAWHASCVRPWVALVTSFGQDICLLPRMAVFVRCYVHGGGVQPTITQRSVVAVNLTAQVELLAGVWRRGPAYLARTRLPIHPVLSAFGLTSAFLFLSSVVASRTRAVPFGSLLAFFLLFTVAAITSNVSGLFVIPADAIGKITSVRQVAWTSTLRSFRLLDAFSDLLFSMSLFKQVSAGHCGVTGALRCPELRTCATVATVAACIDFALTVALQRLGKQFQTREDTLARRSLMAVYSISAVCELALVAIHVIPLRYRSKRSTSEIVFVCGSILVTAASFVGNVMGAGRVLTLTARALAKVVPEGVRRSVTSAGRSLALTRKRFSSKKEPRSSHSASQPQNEMQLPLSSPQNLPDFSGATPGNTTNTKCCIPSGEQS